jgi:hypothetical protein
MKKSTFFLFAFWISFSLNINAIGRCMLVPDADSIQTAAGDTGKTTQEPSSNPVMDQWKIGGAGSINLSQGYLSYWAEGGQSSISSLAVLQLFANQKVNKFNWDNFLEMKYGLLKSGDLDIRKNEDKIEMSSKVGYKAIYNLYYSVNMDFKTQIDYGYEYPNDSTIISAFMSPGSVMLSLGLDYKPDERLSVLVSPITSKTTFVFSDLVNPTKFGLEEGRLSKNETGAFVKTLLKVDLSKEILLTNRLDFFTNYLHNPENVDVNWQMNLTLKVNKYINTTINTHLIYDDDILVPVEKTRLNENGDLETYMGKSKKIQFKELLAIGLNYKF